MNQIFTIIFKISLFLVLLVTATFAQDQNEIRDAYQKAKMKTMERKWKEALPLFDEFLQKYPESKYEDDALFWIGYSQEQLPGMRKEAFDTYSKLVKKYPESTWVNDALGHQIILAEQFVLAGQTKYKDFLFEQLKKEQTEYQYPAAIALGKFGDTRALPVLEQMKTDEDFGDLALELIPALSAKRDQIDDESRRVEDKSKMDLAKKEDPIKSEDAKPAGFMVFGTERHEQYTSMLRKDDDWSRDDLVNFALWHILETEEFKEYISLVSDNDKEEWRRKYWKRRDPTPTTEINEIEEEFQRRIEISRLKFSEFWNYSNFNYLPYQYLRQDIPHAPWDSRGELYIKYGDPDFRSIQGFNQEVWTYSRYKVDFLVKQYMTNIYGNAIRAGEMSYRSYGDRNQRRNDFDHLNPLSSAKKLNETLWNSVNMYVQTNFIFNQEIRYAHNYNADLIEEIEFYFDEKSSQEKKGIVFRYQLPVDEFELVSQPGGLEVQYKEIYCVLDEDLHEVTKQENIRRIGNIPNDDFKFEESILLSLPEGKYTIHLRIEDQNAENLALSSYDFEVRDL